MTFEIDIDKIRLEEYEQTENTVLLNEVNFSEGFSPSKWTPPRPTIIDSKLVNGLYKNRTVFNVVTGEIVERDITEEEMANNEYSFER